MGRLLRRYVPVLQAHLVRKYRLAPERAEDLVQGFITRKVLQEGLLARVDLSRGKFRSFLATALHHYMISELRRDGASPDALGRAVSVDAPGCTEPAALDNSADSLDLPWAWQVLGEACRRLEKYFVARQQPEVWDIFRLRYLAERPLSYGQLLERFGRSRGQIDNAMRTARERFGQILRSLLRGYAPTPDPVEDLVGDLIQIFRNPGAAAGCAWRIQE